MGDGVEEYQSASEEMQQADNPLIEETWPRPMTPAQLDAEIVKMKHWELELLLNAVAERVGRRPNLAIDKDGTVGGGEPLTLEQLKREYALANANLTAVLTRCSSLKEELRRERALRDANIEAVQHFNFRDLQDEAAAWTEHNFPNQKPFEPALGMVEELGEFADAVMRPLQEMMGSAGVPQEALRVFAMASCLGTIAHCRLKQLQGIRGSHEELEAEAVRASQTLVQLALYGDANSIRMPGTSPKALEDSKDAVADLIIFTTNFCTKMGWDFQQIVESTWREVAKRDWTKNKVDGSAEAL